MPKKKKISIFSIFMLILTTLLSISMVFALNYLWDYLEAYEKQNPARIAENYAQKLLEGDFSQIIETSGFQANEFNDEKMLSKYISTLANGNISSIKVFKTGNDGKTLKYGLFCGEKEILSFSLSPDGKKDKFGLEGWKIATEKISGKKQAKIIAPKGAKVYIGNTAVSDRYLKENQHSISAYSVLLNQELAPQFSTYEVSGLLNEPEISAALENGEKCKISKQDDSFLAYPEVSKEFENEAKEVVQTAAIKYATYTTQDISFDELSPYLFKESSFYKKIKDFKNEWQPEHTFEYSNVSITNIVKYDETHFSADISFKYTLKRKYRENSYDVNYSMAFIKSDGQWKLVCIL